MPGGMYPNGTVLLQWYKIGKPHHPQETRGWGLEVMIVILFACTFITVSARLWARLRLQHNAGLDDAIVVVAMIPTLGLAVSECLGTRLYGFDRHVWDLTFDLAIKSRKITLANEALYIVSTSLTKISILLFYRRMTQGAISPAFHMAVRASIGFVVAYMITFLTALFLGCRPLHSYWDSVNFVWRTDNSKNYHCFHEGANVLAASGVSIIQDFIACGMPTILFWKLQMPRSQKFALCAIFGVGFFLCITGILRIYYIARIYYFTYDVTWAAHPVWAWTAVETHVAIICASAPALKVFFKKYLKESHIGLSMQKSFRARKTNKNEKKSAFGSLTSKTGGSGGDSKRTYPVTEKGKIAVTRAVDVDVESLRPKSHAESRDNSTDGLHGSNIRDHIHESVAVPWLELDPRGEHGDTRLEVWKG